MTTAITVFCLVIAACEYVRRFVFMPPKPILRGNVFRAPGETLQAKRAPVLTLVVNKPMREWP